MVNLYFKIKGTSGVTVSMFTMLENISHSIRTASSAVHATKADTHAEFEITNRDYGTWTFDITGHAGIKYFCRIDW